MFKEMVLEGLVQHNGRSSPQNKDKLRSFQEQFIDDPFTGIGGTRLVMTTGRLNA